ncbi:MAG: hypothetical protein KBD27_01705 [Candidatus Moranbacteria bacterium]|nr:hypothetical protein [Candidatus Moranbacteria bacterium]
MNQRVFLSIVGGVVAVGAIAVVGANLMAPQGRSDWRGMRMEERLDRRGDRQDERLDRSEYQGRGAGMGQGVGRGSEWGMNANRGNCVADECLLVDGLEYPAGTLSDAAKQALLSALDDEYRAFASYQAVMATLGSVRPFSMIIRAEEQHISSLKSLFDKYDVTIPENPYLSKVAVPNTLQSACQVGVDAEIANASLYQERLLPAVKDYADISGVFTNLMNASQERHLPAFERCN